MQIVGVFGSSKCKEGGDWGCRKEMEVWICKQHYVKTKMMMMMIQKMILLGEEGRVLLAFGLFRLKPGRITLL